MAMSPAKAPEAHANSSEVEALCEKCQQQLEVSRTFFAFNSLYIAWRCPECGCRFIAPAENKANDDNERVITNTPKRVNGNDLWPWKSNVRRPVEEEIERKEMREARQTQRLYQKWQSLQQQKRTRLSWEEWLQRRSRQNPQRASKLLEAIQRGDLNV